MPTLPTRSPTRQRHSSPYKRRPPRCRRWLSPRRERTTSKCKTLPPSSPRSTTRLRCGLAGVSGTSSAVTRTHIYRVRLRAAVVVEGMVELYPTASYSLPSGMGLTTHTFTTRYVCVGMGEAWAWAHNTRIHQRIKVWAWAQRSGARSSLGSGATTARANPQPKRTAIVFSCRWHNETTAVCTRVSGCTLDGWPPFHRRHLLLTSYCCCNPLRTLSSPFNSTLKTLNNRPKTSALSTPLFNFMTEARRHQAEKRQSCRRLTRQIRGQRGLEHELAGQSGQARTP